MSEKIVLKMRGIEKVFPGVVALDHVDFTLRQGEIHALMGENGAGKSTLIKVLTGVYELDGGEIFIGDNAKTVMIHSPQEAKEKGISAVYQEISLCPNLTVAENLFLGREPKKHGFIDWKSVHEQSQAILKSLDIPVDYTRPLDECSIAIQQMVAIARAVDMKCQVLILDEPTSSLDDGEVEKLFRLMTQLKEQGVGIVFVTHFLEQVYAICDRITVLRNGELVGEYAVDMLPRIQLVAKMMGKDFDDLKRIKNDTDLEVNNQQVKPLIEARGLGRSNHIKPFDLDVYSGEVIGFTGLLGSGRSELVRSLYGADKPDSGRLKMHDEEIKFRTPKEAINNGLAYLPEDRKRDGIIDDLSVRENIIIALQAKRGLFKPMGRKEMEDFADQYIDLLQIKTASRETPIKNLSGGNQQKVIIGRWLLTNPEYLILDEPTRGIDIGTKTEIQKLVLKLAKEGMGIAFISSEIDEMLRTCSRMIVMRDHEKVGELTGEALTEEHIMNTIAGGVKKDEKGSITESSHQN